MTSLFDLSGRTALVTGSTRGLGRAMAFSLAEAGARVVLNYANDKERGLACQRSFEEAGHESLLVGASVIDEGNVDRLVSKVESEFGGVDILVVNATPMQPRNPIESYDWAFHQEMIDYFLKSPFLLARRILPRMKAQKWGRIINIGSEVLARGIGHFSPYVAAKGTARMDEIHGYRAGVRWHHRQHDLARMDPGGAACRCFPVEARCLSIRCSSWSYGSAGGFGRSDRVSGK